MVPCQLPVDWEGSMSEKMVCLQEAAFNAVILDLPVLFTSKCELRSQGMECIGFWEYVVE